MRYIVIRALFLLSILLSPVIATAGPMTIAGDPCSIPLIAELVKRMSLEAEIRSVGCALGVEKALLG